MEAFCGGERGFSVYPNSVCFTDVKHRKKWRKYVSEKTNFLSRRSRSTLKVRETAFMLLWWKASWCGPPSCETDNSQTVVEADNRPHLPKVQSSRMLRCFQQNFRSSLCRIQHSPCDPPWNVPHRALNSTQDVQIRRNAAVSRRGQLEAAGAGVALQLRSRFHILPRQ